MSLNSRKECIENARVDYRKAKKAQKTIILDHMESVTKLNRKYVIRVLGAGRDLQTLLVPPYASATIL